MAMSSHKSQFPFCLFAFLLPLAMFLNACNAAVPLSQPDQAKIVTVQPSLNETSQVQGMDTATQELVNALGGKIEGEFALQSTADVGQASPSNRDGVEELGQPEFSPEELAVIEVIDAMQAEDIEAIVELVPERGLVIAPYGVGIPEVGLTGQALRQTLQALLTGTELSVVTAADTLSPDLIGFIVEGLNPVEVQPAVGEPFVVTGYTLVSLKQAPEGQFLLDSLAVDVHGLMAESLAYPPFTGHPTLLSDEQARAIIRELEESLQTADVDALVDIVNYRGLIVGPYGVGLPNRGLTGEALTEALLAMLKGAQPEVVSYQFRIGGLSIVVEGLNPVQIDPLHGDPLTITSPVLMDLTQDKDESWILWAVIADPSGDLEDMLARNPYWPWKK